MRAPFRCFVKVFLHCGDCLAFAFVMFLRQGASVAGLLEASGLGEALPQQEVKGTTFLKSLCQHSNRKLISQLKEAEQGAKMLQIAREDARLGRLTEPRPIEVVCCSLAHVVKMLPLCLSGMRHERHSSAPAFCSGH
jgi:hypothetical protein